MSEKELAQKFLSELEKLKNKKKDKVGLSDIRLLMERHTQKMDNSLYQKILTIAVKIHHLRDDIADIDTDKMVGDYLPDANMRLDAVVAATEKATHDILDATSTIQEHLTNLNLDEKTVQPFSDQIMKIFEACNFQDLTGQHINNVVGKIREVETLVKAIVKVLPDDFKDSIKEKAKPQTDHEKELMQGPQITDVPTQDDIDKIFAES